MPKLATTEQIIEAYKETGSVWKAAKKLGLCGQSVWERLKRAGYSLPGSKWTEDEINELIALAGHCTLAEIARRLARPYGSIATKMSDMGLTNRIRAANKAVSLRGTGLTAVSVKRMTRELQTFDGALSQFCRQRGFSIDVIVKAIQKYEPLFWEQYTKEHAATAAQPCAYCNADFYPMTKKQKTCSRKCQAHLRSDKQYFNGQRKTTIGLSEGICQICLQPKKSLSSHHVWGKENDEQADFLIALCNGCHQILGQLASSKRSSDSDYLERLIIFSAMRRNGTARPVGYHCYVELEEMTQEEVEESAW
jgi:hypothetical protein